SKDPFSTLCAPPGCALPALTGTSPSLSPYVERGPGHAGASPSPRARVSGLNHSDVILTCTPLRPSGPVTCQSLREPPLHCILQRGRASDPLTPQTLLLVVRFARLPITCE